MTSTLPDEVRELCQRLTACTTDTKRQEMWDVMTDALSMLERLARELAEAREEIVNLREELTGLDLSSERAARASERGGENE